MSDAKAIPFDRTRRFTREADAIANCPEGWSVVKSPRGSSWRCEPPVRVTVKEAVKEAIAESDPFETKPEAPPPLDVWTLGADIMTAAIPQQRYALAPYFPLECATGLSGQGKVGKSYFMLLVMLSVAAGRPCLGCPVQQGHVWYFSAEDRPDRVRERSREILKDFTPEERARALEHFHCIDAVGKRLFFVASIRGAAHITSVCDQISTTVDKAVLVVVDTVSRINPLLENNEHLALIVSAAEVIASRTGAAVCLNHHVGKSQARSGVTDMYAGRGGSSFGDNCRSVLTLSHATEDQVAAFDERTQEEQQRGNVRVLTHSAASYGREAAPVFLLRRDNGTFAKLDAVIDLLSPLREWVRAKGLTTFTPYMLKRTHVKEIWSPTPSRTEIEKFIAVSIRAEAFVKVEGGQGGGERYTLTPATLEAIESHDVQTVGVISDPEGWDNV